MLESLDSGLRVLSVHLGALDTRALTNPMAAFSTTKASPSANNVAPARAEGENEC